MAKINLSKLTLNYHMIVRIKSKSANICTCDFVKQCAKSFNSHFVCHIC